MNTIKAERLLISQENFLFLGVIELEWASVIVEQNYLAPRLPMSVVLFRKKKLLQ
jgi:hypothetical protein